MQRENFQSRLGFLLVSAGCAIGIGNIWKFPYLAGQNGGGIFVLFYIIFLILVGVPVLTMELAMGRASRKSVIKSYRALEPEGAKWHLHGRVCIIGCYLLMMYYTTVAGWMMDYLFKFASGEFEGIAAGAVDGVYKAMQSSPKESGMWMAIVVVAGFAVCSFGLQKGIERISKVMMMGLIALSTIMVAYNLTLPGAAEGLKFYLLPDFARAAEVGIDSIIIAAMTQAFFTLSVGIASMQVFGSYMTKEISITTESIRICALDTFVSLVAGLIIFPACFSFGVEPASGPSLIFITLPRVFADMAGGRIWGTLFFLFMTCASFSTVIAVFESLIANSVESFGWSRKKAVIVNCIIVLIASMPCVLGFNVLDRVRFGGRNIMDAEDFAVTNLLLPAGALIYLMFCTSRHGWGFDGYIREMNIGYGIKLPRGIKWYFRFGLPILILTILIVGLI